MVRIVIVYGLISGLVVIAGSLATVILNGERPHANVWLGYLVMLLGLSIVLVGVRQYRDEVLGGVIGFLPALSVGTAIAVVASLAYVAAWEVYLAATDYAFMDQYVRATLEARRAEGISAEDYRALQRELAVMAERYRSPVWRLPMTFIEILPVGLIMAVASAALLRNSRFLPARTRS